MKYTPRDDYTNNKYTKNRERILDNLLHKHLQEPVSDDSGLTIGQLIQQLKESNRQNAQEDKPCPDLAERNKGRTLMIKRLIDTILSKLASGLFGDLKLGGGISHPAPEERRDELVALTLELERLLSIFVVIDLKYYLKNITDALTGEGPALSRHYFNGFYQKIHYSITFDKQQSENRANYLNNVKDLNNLKNDTASPTTTRSRFKQRSKKGFKPINHSSSLFGKISPETELKSGVKRVADTSQKTIRHNRVRAPIDDQTGKSLTSPRHQRRDSSLHRVRTSTHLKFKLKGRKPINVSSDAAILKDGRSKLNSIAPKPPTS